MVSTILYLYIYIYIFWYRVYGIWSYGIYSFRSRAVITPISVLPTRIDANQLYLRVF